MHYKIKHWWQKTTRGYSDLELWNLDTTIAKFILPRIIAFKKMERAGYFYGVSEKKTEDILDDMIFYFEKYLDPESSDDFFEDGSEEFKKFNRGRKYFNKYFSQLWD